MDTNLSPKLLDDCSRTARPDKDSRRCRKQLHSSLEYFHQSQTESSTSMNDMSSLKMLEEIDSSFSFATSPLSRPTSPASKDFILDIRKYIPAGSLRICKTDCAISSEMWKSCHSWRAFAHPRDIYSSYENLSLLNALQELLLNSTTLQPYRGLHNAGWIKMEFKMRNHSSGQVRVYIFPDDVARSTKREEVSLRKAMRLLLAQIDIAEDTWHGKWARDTPVSHVDTCMNKPSTKNDASLFHVFNTLPSPNPNPMAVSNCYAQEAMWSILKGDIPGLKTQMFSYQCRSAALMLQRETKPEQNIDPRLRTLIDQKGASWYCDVDVGVCLREPRRYEAPRGGICAETMGLGKTLICLALILATKHLSSQVPVEHSVDLVPKRRRTGSLLDMTAATIGRESIPYKGHLAELEADGYDFARCREAIKKNAGYYLIPGPEPRRQSRHPVVIPPRKVWLTAATIVVVPSNLVQQWRHEIRKHTTGLNVLLVTTDLPPAVELVDYDIILFSKARFVKEARHGLDRHGRKIKTLVCRCPYIGATRTRKCDCFKEESAYRSPLKELHFKRLIIDEGHTFGNASKSSKTEAMTVVDLLQLSARWIVSGTPTQGLYGVDLSPSITEDSSMSGTPTQNESELTEKAESLMEQFPTEIQDIGNGSDASGELEVLFYKQERTDLEKLGNIARVFLKARPWANTYHDNDPACWVQYVMQPRHGPKSHGNMDCLRSTLEGMIIRHRPEDVLHDVTLPPLHQAIVKLNGSVQNKLSLNVFSLMIITNAITSERKDADYFFHPRQRKPLQELVSNLRQASFLWSGTSVGDIQATLHNAKKFLEERKVPVSPADQAMLQLAIKIGQTVVSNDIFRLISKTHEMPMYLQNSLQEDVRMAWALDAASTNPTLIGATMIHAAQKFVESQLWREDPMHGMAAAGNKIMHENKAVSQEPHTTHMNSKGSKTTTVVADGTNVGHSSSSAGRSRRSFSARRPSFAEAELIVDETDIEPLVVNAETDVREVGLSAPHKPTLKQSAKLDIAGTLDPSSPLNFTSIISTASAKLSYLIDRITDYQGKEKILVFYEADNIAYYIAQALECLGIKHLIYAKALSSERRSQYVVTFNRSEVFRVLLMDVSQAAFGLDLSSASRVYFVNPVFNPQVEAQAIKRTHRIGQTKPVFVETLVLRGSIEEVILERRKCMSTEEHKRCKNILDDQTVYDWIRNARFLSFPCGEIPGYEQMAKLGSPQPVFCRGTLRIGVHDSDADLVLDDLSPLTEEKGKGKERAEHLSRILRGTGSSVFGEEKTRPMCVANSGYEVSADLAVAQVPLIYPNDTPSPSDSTWSGCSDTTSPHCPPPADLPRWMDPTEYINSVQHRLAKVHFGRTGNRFLPTESLDILREVAGKHSPHTFPRLRTMWASGEDEGIEQTPSKKRKAVSFNLDDESPSLGQRFRSSQSPPKAASASRSTLSNASLNDSDPEESEYSAKKLKSMSFGLPRNSSNISQASRFHKSPTAAWSLDDNFLATTSSNQDSSSSSRRNSSLTKKHQVTTDSNGVSSLMVKLDIGRKIGLLPTIEASSTTMRRNLEGLGWEHTGKGWREKPKSSRAKMAPDGIGGNQDVMGSRQPRSWF